MVHTSSEATWSLVVVTGEEEKGEEHLNLHPQFISLSHLWSVYLLGFCKIMFKRLTSFKFQVTMVMEVISDPTEDMDLNSNSAI